LSRGPLALFVAALLLAAASAPCPPGSGPAAPASAATFAAAPVHASHAARAERGGLAHELRAPCPCGCRHAAAGAPGSARLDPALLRGAPALARPWLTTAVEAPAAALADAPARIPDKVPRAA
jgi:hypothetical protein